MRLSNVISLCGIVSLVIPVVLAIVFACLPPRDSLDITRESVGDANFIWKIPFERDGPSFDDIFGSNPKPKGDPHQPSRGETVVSSSSEPKTDSESIETTDSESIETTDSESIETTDSESIETTEGVTLSDPITRVTSARDSDDDIFVSGHKSDVIDTQTSISNVKEQNHVSTTVDTDDTTTSQFTSVRSTVSDSGTTDVPPTTFHVESSLNIKGSKEEIQHSSTLMAIEPVSTFTVSPPIADALFTGEDYDMADLERWIHTSEYNNALCKRAFDASLDVRSKCIREGKCVGYGDIERFWGEEDGVYIGCTTDSMRQYQDRTTLSSLCHAQTHYLMDVKKNGIEGLVTDLNFASLLSQSFPFSTLFPDRFDGKEIESTLSGTGDTDSKIRDICSAMTGSPVIHHDRNGTLVSLGFTSVEPLSSTRIAFLRSVLSMREHLIEASSPPHMAETVIIVTRRHNRHAASLWANVQFDWTEGDSPRKTFFDVTDDIRPVEILDSLMRETEGVRKTMFIVQAIDGLKTIRDFMKKYLYLGDLSADHWIYFFPNSDSTDDQRRSMREYLVNNGWEDVHWAEDLTPSNKTGETPSGTPRFYGLRRKNPRKNSWVIHVKESDMDVSEIPESFDYRDHPKSKCLYGVASQGYCGSCWAISAAEMVSSVKCIASDAEYASPVSAQDILSCVEPESYGCNGAYMSDALLTARNFGFANETCDPYFNGDCDDLAKHRSMCSAESARGLQGVPTAMCNQRCEDGTLKSRRKIVRDVYWINSNHGGRTNPSATARLMQEYIMKRGPVLVGIAIYPDFEGEWSQKGEVYVHRHDSTQRLLGGHAVVVVGWGTQMDSRGRQIPYWVAKNSWSTRWGESGYFKLVRGQGGVPYVEDEVYSIELEDQVLF